VGSANLKFANSLLPLCQIVQIIRSLGFITHLGDLRWPFGRENGALAFYGRAGKLLFTMNSLIHPNRALGIFLGLLLISHQCGAQQMMVTKNEDFGPGSLRQIISDQKPGPSLPSLPLMVRA